MGQQTHFAASATLYIPQIASFGWLQGNFGEIHAQHEVFE
jgi:hypothetical protein